MPTAAINGSISLKIGLIFLFNLIVGTGALALPKAFAQAGWLLGSILITLLALVSYVCVTFIIESLSVANALLLRKKTTSPVRSGANTEGQLPAATERDRTSDASSPAHTFSSSNVRLNEMQPLLDEEQREQVSQFEIRQKIELSEVARLFYGTVGANLFFVCMFVYLTGDLAIYATSVSKTIRDLACTANTSSVNSSVPSDDEPCWPDSSLTRMDAYRIFVAAFLVCITPFTFFNLQKTKYLQMATTFFRWTSMTLMISLAVRQILLNAANDQSVQRSAADFDHFTQLFGTAVYAFMCHHSLPSIVTPITRKQKLPVLFSITYALVLTFYLLLSLTGMFAFSTLFDLYTLNFNPNASGITPFNGLIVFQYYLELYPVLTLSTNFPIIAITLRNTLADLARQTLKSVTVRYHFVHACLFRSGNAAFAIIALVIPSIISLCTSDVGLLIAITGSYPGVAIQYVIPVFLVYGARREVLRLSATNPVVHESESDGQPLLQGEGKRSTPVKNWYFSHCNRQLFGSRRQPHVSWFWHPAWLVFVLAWSAFTICFVTAHLIIDG